MAHCPVNHHITGQLVFVLVSTEWVMMCTAIDNPACCEIRTVIRFLHTRNMSAAKIQREFCTVYGRNVMCEGTVRQWCRIVKDGRANRCSRWRAKCSVICSEWWSCSKCWPKNLWKTVLHNFRTFVLISINFKHCSQPENHSLGYHMFCARWIPKLLTGAHKPQRMTSALTF
jgi:hypothetical protein